MPQHGEINFSANPDASERILFKATFPVVPLPILLVVIITAQFRAAFPSAVGVSDPFAPTISSDTTVPTERGNVSTTLQVAKSISLPLTLRLILLAILATLSS